MKVDLKYEKCKTCKYFEKYYVKINSTFMGISCGHCVNRQLNDSRVRNKYDLKENCEFWESNNKEKVARRENIKGVLASMQKHLSAIASILKDDEQ